MFLSVPTIQTYIAPKRLLIPSELSTRPNIASTIATGPVLILLYPLTPNDVLSWHHFPSEHYQHALPLIAIPPSHLSLQG